MAEIVHSLPDGNMTVAKRALMISRTALLVNRLTDYQVLKGKLAQMTELEITNVCNLVADVFTNDPVALTLNLDTPLYIFGDIFGQYGDLLRLFNVLGHPPEKRYLFLGNYVGRNTRSIETMTLLLAYKLRFPNSIYLLRGNHECEHVSRYYGFYDECVRRFSRRLWRSFIYAFDFMPLVAFIEGKIFCTHSGIAPSIIFSGMQSQDEITEHLSKMIPRPTDVETNVIVRNMIWCEPDVQCQNWEINPAGMGFLYGPKVVSQFCDQFKVQQIIRSNEMINNGYEFFVDRRMLTVFSAPNFTGNFKNFGAIVSLVKNTADCEIRCRIMVVKPIMKLRNKLTGRMTIEVEDSSVNIEKVSNLLSDKNDSETD